MSNEAKPLLKIQSYDRYDKAIEISGADFTVWVDNDDVPEGALVFATELAAAWNERDTLRAELAEFRALGGCDARFALANVRASVENWENAPNMDVYRQAVFENPRLRATNAELVAALEEGSALLYEVIGQQHVLKHTLDFVGKWGDDPVFISAEQRKREVARSTEAVEEWHRRMVAVARAFKVDLSKAREEGR